MPDDSYYSYSPSLPPLCSYSPRTSCSCMSPQEMKEEEEEEKGGGGRREEEEKEVPHE